jgi:hypothetical protein
MSGMRFTTARQVKLASIAVWLAAFSNAIICAVVAAGPGYLVALTGQDDSALARIAHLLMAVGMLVALAPISLPVSFFMIIGVVSSPTSLPGYGIIFLVAVYWTAVIALHVVLRRNRAILVLVMIAVLALVASVNCLATAERFLSV